MPFIPLPRDVLEARYNAYIRAQKEQKAIEEAQARGISEDRFLEEESRNRRASMRGGRKGLGTTILGGGDGSQQSLVGTMLLTGSRTLG